MAETLTFDPTPPAEVMSSIEADQAESLAIGEAMMAEQEGLLAGKYKDAEALEQAYLELQKKLGKGDTDDDGEADYTEDEATEESEEDYEDYAIDFLAEVDQEFTENGQLSEETLDSLAEYFEAIFNAKLGDGLLQKSVKSRSVDLCSMICARG